MAKAKLTKKQDAFVKAYLLNGGNATQAAIKAGYSEHTAQQTGSENLLKPVIKVAIEKHQQVANESFIWSKEKKLSILQDTIENAATVCDKKGDFNEGKMYNHSAVVAAIKTHNEMQGDNAPTESTNTLIIDSGTDEW